MGSHKDMVVAGKFDIINQGPYLKDGARGYLYVGEGSFNITPGHSYSSSDFVPLLYADIIIHYQWYDQSLTILFGDDDDSGVITTAS